VFRADSEGAKQVDQLQRRVREGISKLKGLDMGDELSVEILGQLVQGRKTATEITESIYGLSYSEEGWPSSYSKVNRQIRRLESKGLVSKRLFGKDKPYRLTQHAVINLARIGGKEEQLALLPWYDSLVYLVTLGATVAVGMQSLGWFQFPVIQTIALSSFLCAMFGASAVELIRAARRVF
jgi:hypothetical protein